MFSYRDYIKSRSREAVLTGLLILNVLVWFLVWQRGNHHLLKVAFLDVGQGDAIFIETPAHHQVLIDGGRNRKVVSLLGPLMPFGDKTLDVVVATHPDADHIGGLPEVVSRYKVGLFLEPGVESPSELNQELHTRLIDRRVATRLARRGQVINFSDGAKLIILFPDRDVHNWETNDASIVAKLVYGNESFLLTGDSTIRAENILLNLNSKILKSSVLKAGHHGSKTSTSLSYAEAVSPEYAIISAGKDNPYGHPHKEVLDILNKVGAKIFSTISLGTIRFETDGERLKIK